MKLEERALTLTQVTEEYAGVFTVSLLRRLVAKREVAFSKAGRRLVFLPSDLDAYLASRRTEAVR